MGRLTDNIRAACALVARRAGHVHINDSQIPLYAASLPLHTISRPALDPKFHFIGKPQETAAYFYCLDAINFGSGWWPVFRKRAGMSGYFTVAASLTDQFRSSGPWHADDLVQLSPDDCTRIFNQDPANEPVAELMNHFALALNELGRFVIERFQSDFVRLIESADGSAEQLAAMLGDLSYFHDVARYQGREVSLYKRAQLTAADLSIALRDHPLGQFHDLHRLTIFADNLVPHVLRIDGILRYDTDLSARIDAQELIGAGSDQEIELRACAVHASELIVQSLREQGREINAMQVDYLLWTRGGEPKYKQAKPRHRTRTVYY